MYIPDPNRMMSSLSTVRSIYYRGSLEHCNYTCSYCPFGRKSVSADTREDQEALDRFISRIGGWKYGSLRILIIPYGEAMIHRYYREGIMRLAAMPHVIGVSCQTNLSFSVSRFLDEAEAEQADVSKFRFWASYHPEMVGVGEFASKIEMLRAAGIGVCAGAVGDPSAKEQIRKLRQLLDPSVYLFVNAMQGLRKPLSEEDSRFFGEIDNLFDYDRRNAKACLDGCVGGRETLFIDRKGDMYACPRSGIRMGNFYDDSTSDFQPFCLRKVCDCYIAFSNLCDTPLRRMMGDGALWRIPERKKVEAVFFDVDGTLTDAQGRIPDRTVSVLEYMAKRLPLYLSTALPVSHAKKRLGNVFGLFSGGVFADGGLLCYGETIECVPIANPVTAGFPGCRVTRYTREGKVFKYAVLAPNTREAVRWLTELDEEAYQLYQEGRLLTVVDSKAGKKNGLITLCARLEISLREVLVVGNTMHDWPMMSVAGYSCAVMDAEEKLRKLSGYVLNPDSIPVFFDI